MLGRVKSRLDPKPIISSRKATKNEAKQYEE
jgi:uncharacterized DUF497 family protein